MNSDVIVIGGGASGMAAALAAAKTGASVTILEKKEQNGKKILVSGNGHCNYSNPDLSVCHYHTSDPEQLAAFLKGFPSERLLGEFREIGLVSVLRNGGYYPASFQAASVNAAFFAALKQLSVKTLNQVNVTAVERTEEGFRIATDQGDFFAKKVILACGSPAGVNDKRPFNAYEMLASLGLPVSAVFPALTRLTGASGPEPLWDGVRVQGTVSYKEKSYSGELQLKSDGISGIPAFQLAHDVNAALRNGEEVRIRIRFLNDPSREKLKGFLKDAAKSPLTGSLPFRDLIPQILPKKLAAALFKGKPYETLPLSQLTAEAMEDLLNCIYEFSYPVSGTAPMKEAQAAAGGLKLSAVDEHFEVKEMPGLFVTGELLDVDGETGGYNLHFAFASGFTAGEKAGKR